jgi:hypothetical protein
MTASFGWGQIPVPFSLFNAFMFFFFQIYFAELLAVFYGNILKAGVVIFRCEKIVGGSNSSKNIETLQYQ